MVSRDDRHGFLIRWLNWRGEVRLQAADLDNNGARRLGARTGREDRRRLGQGPRFWLQGSDGQISAACSSAPAGPGLRSGGPWGAMGQLALVWTHPQTEHRFQAKSHGTLDYHWQDNSTRERGRLTGDQRINSFGIGGEIEIRSGLLVQKQPIVRPELHFGLGTLKQAEVARILWPNGSVRAEFQSQGRSTGRQPNSG